MFLCAGAVNTTELLFKNPIWSRPDDTGGNGARRALGSHYFPNADSLAAVFDCDEPHEADYGPTITSAMLYNQPAKNEFSCSVDFTEGKETPRSRERFSQPRRRVGPSAGATVTSRSGGEAILSHDPILDWGNWKGDAAGSLALVIKQASSTRAIRSGSAIDGGQGRSGGQGLLGAGRASAVVPRRGRRLSARLEPLLGVFRSPLWLRRNRYL